MKRILLSAMVFLLVTGCGLPPATTPAITVAAMTATVTATQAATQTFTPTVTVTNTPLPPAPTATPTHGPAPTEFPLPANYKLLIQGQTPEDEAHYRAAITHAYNYLRSLGVTDFGPFTLLMFADLNQYRQAAMDYYHKPAWWVERRLRFGYEYGGHGPGIEYHWTETANYRSSRQHGWLDWGVGEYMDGTLLQIAGVDDIASEHPPLPAWLINGVERYFAARVLDDGKNGAYAAARAENITEERIHPHHGGLATVENYGPTYDGWTLGFWALEYLSQHYGGDAKVIAWHQAYKDRLPGETWREAFQKVYGISIRDFNKEFDAYRQVHYPAISNVSVVIGKLTTPTGASARNVWVFPCPANPTFDCVPVVNDVSGDCGCFGEIVPVKYAETLDITIAFGRTAEPSSIFGYYNSQSGFTADQTKATIVPLASGQTFDLGTLKFPEGPP